jgi:uncharacterized protein
MATITELVPSPLLHRFLRSRTEEKILVAALLGTHAFGYPSADSPFELRCLYVEPTENLVGLKDPPRAHNWIGEFEGRRIDFSSMEIGQGLRRLIKGDASIMERILAPRQLIKGEELRRLQKVTRGIICRRFFHFYRNFSKGILCDHEETDRRTVRHVLGAYRLALTGVHLLFSGKVVLDLRSLALQYGFPQVETLIDAYQNSEKAALKKNDPAIHHLVKLHTLLEKALEESTLRRDPDNPKAVEDLLLDYRRSFFESPTVQES